MINLQIPIEELLVLIQQEFPKEYTICLQKIHITKLEAMVEEKTKEQATS